MLTLSYFAVTLATLLVLGLMILRIGRAMGSCPQSGAAARIASVTVSTGFVAIGLGGILLVAATLPLIEAEALALFPIMGFACLVLGLGFTHAVRVLKAVVAPPAPKARPMAEPPVGGLPA